MLKATLSTKTPINRFLFVAKNPAVRYSTQFILLLTLSACVPDLTHPEPGVVGDDKFPALIEKVVSDHNIPALSVSIVRDEQIIDSAAVGLRSFNASIMVDENDQWQMGSISKPITATLAARVVDTGMLRWDTRIEESFAEHINQIDSRLHDITLAQLLQHRSGLARHPSATVAERNAKDRLGFVLREFNANIKSGPGKFEYSNFGYVVAGVMIEKATGMSWELALETYLFSELGIADFGFGVPEAGADLSQPVGHLKRSSNSDNRVNDYWLPIPPSTDVNLSHLQIYGPAGAVYLTKQDFIKFQQVHLDGANGQFDFISQASFDQLHNPGDGFDYSAGWFRENSEVLNDLSIPKGIRVLAHGGNVFTWSAFTILLPDTNTSIFIGTNSDSGVPREVLELLLQRLEVI